MKVFSIVLISVSLPVAIQASPIAEAESETAANPILEARDVYCTLGESVHSRVGCHWAPGEDIRTWIQPNMRFGVGCYMTDVPVGPQRNVKWDWIPGWGCYVSARWTNRNCEVGVPKCSW